MAKSTVQTTIKPLGDKILVKRDEAKTKTDKGIILPEAGQTKSVTGIVEAVGDGQLDLKTGARIPVGVKKGDRVLLSKYGGNEIELGELKLFFVDPDDILAVVEG
jgi:chaperonin GroES